ncbi:hypothetical protein J2Y58_003924 [Sphingomonas sp. BE138]|uniref:hypothetical protein n=1 Tax=Sphingomonas sp. BE138 TaxID=2817845 RepID=UPI00285E0101|nr:hypothetical protein [Sphingomonas sp. BE138]MDR6790541.1 hypothetical protein [Sphingomonas sp. BE138]
MYTIHHDPAAHRLTIVTHGFWTPAVTAAFAAELLARGTAARLRHGAFTVLADLRAAAIQPTAVVEALAAMMPRALKVTSRPIAAIVAGPLAKLQTERYLVGPNCRTFLDPADAERWLSAAA